MEKICGIYAIRNKVNGKMYIGQQIDIKSRWKQHVRELKSKTHCNSYLQYSWDKYGEDCFDFFIIEECESGLLNKTEMYYISKYDTFKNGYNLTLGGDGSDYSEEERMNFRKKRKPLAVLQIDLLYNIVNRWNSAAEASYKTGFDYITILVCCKPTSQIKLHKSFFWVYEEYLENCVYPEDYFVIKNGKPKSVYQFDTRMNFIKKWDSISQVKEAGFNPTGVQKVCTGVCNTSQGFVWRFVNGYTKEQYFLDKNSNIGNTSCGKIPVMQFDLKGNFIQEFESISKASKYVGACLENIRSACLGKQTTCKGYLWRFSSDGLFPDKEKINLEDKINGKSRNSVCQYDIKGNMINMYSSIIEASKSTGVCSSIIADTCKKMRLLGGGFFWRYKNDLPPNKDDILKAIEDNNRRKIIQYDFNLKKIDEFDSVAEAHKKTGISKSLICNACSNMKKSAGGFIWRHLGDDLPSKEEVELIKKYVFPKRVSQFDLQLNVLYEYETVTQAAKSTGISRGNIEACCLKKRKTAGGYIWRYADEEVKANG